jgi:ATP-dependent DNA helicase DinG
MDKQVQIILEQLVFDSELFVLEDYHIKMIEEYLEFFSYGLSILLKEDEGIFWLEENATETSFVIMPRLVEDILKKEVFTQNIPFVFSSATLSRNTDFSYMSNSLGIDESLSFSVESPFDYVEQMNIYGHIDQDEEKKWEEIGSKLVENDGRSLILFSSVEEMNRFRSFTEQQNWSFQMIYEGDGEISEAVKEFQFNETAVLCSYHLWEGLDVPGQSLTQVLISSLPFPPQDPVFKAKRMHALDPVEEVDAPYMLLRLRQGIGRLIRSSEDKGAVHIWMNRAQKEKHEASIQEVFPVSLNWQ